MQSKNRLSVTHSNDRRYIGCVEKENSRPSSGAVGGSPKLLDVKHYRVWTNEKGREIQAPHGWLAQVHKRIGALLARIELPNYVYSQKGRSYADNARAHRGETPLIKTDISRFYPSVTRQAVFRMFIDDFECAVDVAHRLADVCCYKQAHLPPVAPLADGSRSLRSATCSTKSPIPLRALVAR
jgi:hypothetical protein